MSSTTQTRQQTSVNLPQYAQSPLYSAIDSVITNMMVSVFDALNPNGIQLTQEQVAQIMQNQQNGGAYKGFVQDFLDYFNNLILKDYPIIGYSLLIMAAYVAYKMITKCIVIYYS